MHRQIVKGNGSPESFTICDLKTYIKIQFVQVPEPNILYMTQAPKRRTTKPKSRDRTETIFLQCALEIDY